MHSLVGTTSRGGEESKREDGRLTRWRNRSANAGAAADTGAATDAGAAADSGTTANASSTNSVHDELLQ